MNLYLYAYNLNTGSLKIEINPIKLQKTPQQPCLHLCNININVQT